jgi:hypothetical protein
VNSTVSLVFFPRAILSVAWGSDTLYKETPDQGVVLSSSHPLGDFNTPRLRCLFRPTAASIGSAALNSSYSTMPTFVDQKIVSCPLPIVWDSTLDHLWLNLQLERTVEGLPVDLTSAYRIWLKPLPQIMYIEPAVLPAGLPISDHRVKLKQMKGIDHSLHAIVLGDSTR